MFLDVGDDFALVGDEGSPLVYVRLGVPDSDEELHPLALFNAIVFYYILRGSGMNQG